MVLNTGQKSALPPSTLFSCIWNSNEHDVIRIQWNKYVPTYPFLTLAVQASDKIQKKEGWCVLRQAVIFTIYKKCTTTITGYQNPQEKFKQKLLQLYK